MLECGRVKKVEGNLATISFARHGKCDGCFICRASNDGAACELSVVNDLDACEGDFVKVAIFKRSTRVLSAALYLLPLLLTSIGVAVGCFMSAAATAIIGTSCFAVGLGTAIALDFRIVRKMKGFAPRMTELCSESEYETGFTHTSGASAIKLK